MSEYCRSLSDNGRKQYREKLTLENGLVLGDPYQVHMAYALEGWLDDIAKFPDISSHDITKYLIETPSLHTNETSNAFKSLDGFKFFREGHVQDCFYHESGSPFFCFIKSKVSFTPNKISSP